MRSEFCAWSNSGLADRAGLDQRLEALDLLPPVLRRPLPCRRGWPRCSHRGLLLVGVDLDERRADAHVVAGLDEDARDHALDFRLDRRRAERPQRGDEVRRVCSIGFGASVTIVTAGRRRRGLRAAPARRRVPHAADSAAPAISSASGDADRRLTRHARCCDAMGVNSYDART